MQRGQVLAQRGRRLGRARRGGPELPGRVLGDRRDQVLLGGEVVVQRGVVDADLLGDLAQPQPLEPDLGHPLERGAHQLFPPILSTNHLVESTGRVSPRRGTPPAAG